jgi:hypothetical protein
MEGHRLRKNGDGLADLSLLPIGPKTSIRVPRTETWPKRVMMEGKLGTNEAFQFQDFPTKRTKCIKNTDQKKIVWEHVRTPWHISFFISDQY